MTSDGNKTFLKKFSIDYNSLQKELYEKNMIRDSKSYSVIENKDISEISRSGRKNESNILYDKHLSVEKIMSTLLERKEYNILLYNRSIIQYDFMIKDGKIIKERLTFIKKHNYLWTKEEISNMDINNFETDWFDNEMGIPVMIRVDYDEDNHIDVIHPITHMTLSNYDECRIPMMGPISLYNFIDFILNFFYDDRLDFKSKFEKNDITITENEKKRIHLEWQL